MHTPGPWLIEYNNADDRAGGKWYMAGPARVHFPYGCGKEEADTAYDNARLIAAAPDLLEACKWATEKLELEFSASAARVNFPELYSAIAKATVPATGES